MAMIFFSSPATLTGAEEKKTGPSRFIADFPQRFFDRITELTEVTICRVLAFFAFSLNVPQLAGRNKC